jgi:GNAT superfamily N-acetyltransferase
MASSPCDIYCLSVCPWALSDPRYNTTTDRILNRYMACFGLLKNRTRFKIAQFIDFGYNINKGQFEPAIVATGRCEAGMIDIIAKIDLEIIVVHPHHRRCGIAYAIVYPGIECNDGIHIRMEICFEMHARHKLLLGLLTLIEKLRQYVYLGKYLDLATQMYIK